MLHHNIMLLFGDVKRFLTKNSDIGPSLRPKLLDMLHHLPTVIQLKLIVTCYEEILKLRTVVHSFYYQNFEAVIQSFSKGNVIIQHPCLQLY